MINVAILGYGTVGSGVHEVLIKNSKSIEKKAGDKISVKYILDIRDFSNHSNAHLFVKDFDVILNDNDVKIIAEVIGGIKPAYEFTKAALLAGKSVVTSNKELVATKGHELLKIAKEKNVSYLFEASVGGGIPIIRPMHQCLAANEIEEITGILNGTTNYILTKMINENQNFADVLKDAQDKGYAESNPDADILGYDACRKIAILSSLAFSKHVDPEKIYTQGITEISLEDVEYAKSMSGVIKLLGRAKLNEDNTVSAMVSPCIIKNTHPLANVDDVFNGILLKGDSIGDVMFYGRGAGKLPTASAVVADIIDASHQRRDIYWEKPDYEFVKDYKEYKNVFYIRIKGENLQNYAKEVFGDISFINNKNSKPDEFAFITKEIKESEMNNLKEVFCEKFKDAKIVSIIRVIE